MKKILLALSLVSLVAAGCNTTLSRSTQTEVTQQNSSGQKTSQSEAQSNPNVKITDATAPGYKVYTDSKLGYTFTDAEINSSEVFLNQTTTAAVGSVTTCSSTSAALSTYLQGVEEDNKNMAEGNANFDSNSATSNFVQNNCKVTMK